MAKTQIEKFVNNSLKEIQSSLPKGFRIDEKINFDVAVVTKGKTSGGIDIKLANLGSDIESQTVHRIKFSVVDEVAQKKSWNQGKKVLGELFSKIVQLDESPIGIENKTPKR